MKWYVKWDYSGNITGPFSDIDEAKQEIAEYICGFEREEGDDGMGMIFSDAILQPNDVVKVDLKDSYKAVVPIIR